MLFRPLMVALMLTLLLVPVASAAPASQAVDPSAVFPADSDMPAGYTRTSQVGPVNIGPYAFALREWAGTGELIQMMVNSGASADASQEAALLAVNELGTMLINFSFDEANVVNILDGALVGTTAPGVVPPMSAVVFQGGTVAVAILWTGPTAADDTATLIGIAEKAGQNASLALGR